MVSVIIATYRRPRLLPRAIKSALAQTFRDFELIVVDDASGDHTESVVASFDDTRIKYVRHDVNKGGPAARNTGIGMAKGEYIALLDDDDEWHATKLEKQVNAFKETANEVSFVYSGFEILDEKGEVVGTTLPEHRGYLHMNLLQRNMIGGSSIPLIQRECFDKVGLFDESLTSCQDWDMWLRIAREFEFDYVPEVLAKGYLHGDQISENFAAMIPGRTRIIEKHMAFFSNYPHILVTHLKRMGKMHCLNGTWKEAIYWFRRALAVNIFEIVNVLAWCVIELPRIAMSTRAKTFKKYYPKDG